jgi:hypothetical protein
MWIAVGFGVLAVAAFIAVMAILGMLFRAGH